MKIVKMSLVAAVAVAGLSTASLAEVAFSGKADFRWKSIDQGDVSTNGSTRERIDLHVKSASKDGKGKVHLGFRTDGDETGILRAYADYKLSSVTLAIGPRMNFPGNFSYSTIRGITASTKVAGFTLGVGIADRDTGSQEKEKSVITAKGKVAIADLRFDYVSGNEKKDLVAADVKVKVGPATIIGAYSTGMGDNNKDVSLMGADVSVGVGSITAFGAFSLSGKNGGKLVENYWTSNALGDITGSRNPGEVTAMKFGAKTTMSGVKFGGYYSMATPDGGETDTKIYVAAKKSLNTQSAAQVRYYIETPGAATEANPDKDSKNTIELRFSSKF